MTETTMPANQSAEGGADPGRVMLFMNGKHYEVADHLAAYANRKKSFLQRMFPTSLDRVLEDGELNSARNHTDMVNRLVALNAEITVQACRQVGDTWLKTLKSQDEQQFMARFTARSNQFSREIEGHRQEFGQHIRERKAHADEVADMPNFQKLYLNSIEAEAEGVMTMMDQMLRRFRAIIEQELAAPK